MNNEVTLQEKRDMFQILSITKVLPYLAKKIVDNFESNPQEAALMWLMLIDVAQIKINDSNQSIVSLLSLAPDDNVKSLVPLVPEINKFLDKSSEIFWNKLIEEWGKEETFKQLQELVYRKGASND